MPMELVQRPMTGTNSMKVQPALVGERDPEDLAPEAVGGDHRIGLFFLSGLERLEGVGLLAVFKRGVSRWRRDGTQQRAAEDTGYAHHVEGVQGPVMEALEEQQEAEDRCHAEARSANQLLWPRGYIRKTLTNTAIGPEKAMALYGRMPTRRAISN